MYFGWIADIINQIKSIKKMPRLSRTKEENEILDQQLREIVQEHLEYYGNTINWKKICQKLFLKYSIKLNNKQCAQRYKNYSSKIYQPSLSLTSQQQQEIFMRHCQGENGGKIRNQMNLQTMSQNTLKNTLKRQKERIGRILKKVLGQNFSKMEFDFDKFPPKDQFRVIIILFSTAPLLNHYMKKGIKILDFRDRVFQFETLSSQISKKNQSSNLKEELITQKLQKMETLRTQILEELEIIFDIYERVYLDPFLSKELIGLRELKNLGEKYIYTKALILDMPLKLCRDQQGFSQIHERQFQKVPSNLEEGNQIGFSCQLFGNFNFFDQQIIDCSFSKDFPTFSASSKKHKPTMAIDEEDTSPKVLFMQDESENHLDRYFV